MRFKISSRQALFITASILFLAAIFYFLSGNSILSNQAPLTENNTDAPKKEKINSDLPVRLKIPKINVDSAIEYVGLTDQGAMDVPSGPVDVAWFNLGPRPGESGSAVISGHYGWKNNIPAVFDNLYKLSMGDRVYVEYEKGIMTTFVVRELKSYDQNENAVDVFTSDDGIPHLNLVTCEGVWDKIKKSYSNRLVVFTDIE